MDLTDKIEDYIESNKSTLLKNKREDENKIKEIRKAHKSTLHRSRLDRSTISMSDFTDNDSVMSIPDEKDWRHEIDVLQHKTG